MSMQVTSILTNVISIMNLFSKYNESEEKKDLIGENREDNPNLRKRQF